MDEGEPVGASAMTGRRSGTWAGRRRYVMMVPGTANRCVARGLVLPEGANVGVLVVNTASQSRYGTTFIIK